MNVVERLKAYYQLLINDLPTLITAIITVLALTVLFFYIMNFLADNNAKPMIVIFVFVIIIAGGISLFNEQTGGIIFILCLASMVIMVVVLYAIEIKSVIWQRNSMKLVDVKYENIYDAEKVDKCVNEIIKALQDMSKNDVGAIIVLSSGNVPTQILDSGVKMDSDISSALIESVFFPKTPLHDGAMIINGMKIVASGCFLPLSQNINIPKDLGTRHRAGLGITETIDVASIIVSEETGIITVARAGKFTRYADTETLKKMLNKYYWQEINSAKK